MDKIALLALKKSGAVDVGLAVSAKEAAEAAQEAAETAQGKAEDAVEELEQTVEDVEELQTDVSNLKSHITNVDEAVVFSAEGNTFDQNSISLADVIVSGATASTFDGTAVIDGVNVKVTSLNGQSTDYNNFMLSNQVNKADGIDNFVSDRFQVVSTNSIEMLNGRASSNNIELRLLKTRCEYSVEAANAWLKANPIRIWFVTPDSANATEFYQYITYTSDGIINRSIGTLDALPNLQDGDTISFGTGKYNINGVTSVVDIAPSISVIPKGSRITSTGSVAIKELTSIGNELDKKVNLDGVDEVIPKITNFFAGVNYFDPTEAVCYTNRFVGVDGKIATTGSSNTTSVVFRVLPNTVYWFYAPGKNRSYAVESDDNLFTLGQTYNVLVAEASKNLATFTTGATTKFVFFYFYSGTYDYDANKNSISLTRDNYYAANTTPFIPNKHLPDDVKNPLNGRQILVFGDSITDTCNFTINGSDETTAVSWKNPSNSYVDAGGTTITYSMWPKILKDSQTIGEIRNYARSGASYKTAQRTSGEERQNLQYQITVALNDKNNPNDVFEIDNFVPDIVIFALGTNDGAPNDTFESAMSKTVLESDGYSIDVDATLSALDDSKFCESARKAFMRIKQAFPMAQIYCVLPIQRANDETNFGTLHQYLSEIARRYGCIIIDGTAESGITRDFNIWNDLGIYLKDGLHPNEKGQNLMARMIISALKSHYIPFGVGFNAVT